MPARLRHSTAATEAAKDQHYSIPGLNFHQPLSWRAGKAIPVADLLTRLEKLASLLRQFNAERVDPNDFKPLAGDLANTNLLGHKDKGVRAWTVVCAAEVLKICAPNAPCSDAQLKDIFTVFITAILPYLTDTSNAYHTQHLYILTLISESQSICAIQDIPNGDTLIISLFTTCFDIISGSTKYGGSQEVSKTVEFHLKALLLTVVDEFTLSQEMTDVILSQFMRVDSGPTTEQSSRSRKGGTGQDTKQGTLLLKEYPPAYNMAKVICTSCIEKMTAQVTQYFGSIIVDAASLASKANGDVKGHQRRVLDDDNESGDEAEGLADLRKAHRLLKELWRACPDVIVNVIPQIEAEVAADSPLLRQLATETLGDMTAGIGIAGLQPSNALDPTIYPLPTIDDSDHQQQLINTNPLFQPASPKPFHSVHALAYRALLGRRHDKAVSVRCVWVSEAVKILYTRAGGTGINEQEKLELLSGISQMLQDHEDKVRLAAIKSLHRFDYYNIIDILGSDGGLSNPSTVLSTLADRVTDRKHMVREEAIGLLARMWGVASRDIEAGNATVIRILGNIPSKLLAAYFTNDAHIHALLDKALYEYLLPLSYPPTKSQASQKSGKKSAGGSQSVAVHDPDMIRVKRILVFIKSLDSKSRPVFFGMQNRQVQMQRGMTIFLNACEDFNGGVFEDDVDGEKVKKQLTTYIEALSKAYAESSRIAADLWKFAKLHNRRDYQLIRFAMGPEHDYRTMTKAIKELTKRIKEGPSSAQSLMETLMPLLYRCALVVYNRSHVPAIMEISTFGEQGLAEVAQEVLKEISIRNPEVLKKHIQQLCTELEENAPSQAKEEPANAADTMKACAHFARQYPQEAARERKFLTALVSYAIHSRSPKAAKHAVSIIMSIAEKKEMYAKEILSKALKGCVSSSPHYLARLASISQICLLAPATAGEEADAILRLAVDGILHKNQSPSEGYESAAWEAEPDTETQSKTLALRILVNRCRGEPEDGDSKEFDQLATTVLNLLTGIVNETGEITPTKNTSSAQRNRLRLDAAHFMLKLCAHKSRVEDLITPTMFIQISTIMVNPPIQVRTGFVNQLKKYIGMNKLNHRWITILYLLAFEPDTELKVSTITWLKSRVQFFARQRKQATSKGKSTASVVMESTFARLLHLLAHHPDYPEGDGPEFEAELLDYAKYLVFYLVSVATDDNLSLIFHVAQRVKQTRDALTGSEEINQRLYVLSDLAQAVIRNYVDLLPTHGKGNNLLQTWPGTVPLPRSLFGALPNHDLAQGIADKNYLPEDVATGLEKMVRAYIKWCKSAHGDTRKEPRDQKRKSGSAEPDGHVEDEDERPSKRAKKRALPIRRTPKAKKTQEPASSEAPSRKSARVSHVSGVSYAEGDSEADDAEMEEFDRLASSPVTTRKGKSKSKARGSPSESPSDALSGDHEEDIAEDEDAVTDEAYADKDEGQAANEVADHDMDDDVHVHEDQADSEQESDAASDRGTSPSPLREAKNLKTEKSIKKTASGSPITKAAAPKKGKKESATVTSTKRQTRRTKV